jgi:hypothetical protein
MGIPMGFLVEFLNPVAIGVLPLCLITALPVFAQVNSPATSVTLVARVQESVAVQHVVLLDTQADRNDQAAPHGALLVSFQWRFDQGKNIQMKCALNPDQENRSAPSPTHFASLSKLASASAAFAFQSQRQLNVMALGPVPDPEQTRVGTVNFLVGVNQPNSDVHTIRISFGVF